jgi:hypothetical protein
MWHPRHWHVPTEWLIVVGMELKLTSLPLLYVKEFTTMRSIESLQGLSPACVE